MRSKLELRSLMLLLLVLLPFSAAAQTTTPSPTPPAAAPSGDELLRPEQLDAIVAPIALYPDSLLAQVFIAASYPLEVVQAERWAAANKDLKGDALKQAIEKLTWDDSVKSLIATPSVLTMMSKKLDWTQKLGDAVLAQETDVMDAVQRLRVRAQGTDKLKSTKEQNVTVRQEGGKQVVAIQSTNPETVYVPYYDPAVVYGTWPYPEYPADYYYPDDYWFPGGVIAAGIAFGTGYALWRWWDNNHWRGHIDWNKRDININRNGRVEAWRHNPQHRHGVAYNNPKVRQQFAGATGRPGDRAKAGQRPAGGQKAGDRAKQAGAGQAKRPAQGNKQAKGSGKAQGKRTAQGKAQGKKSAQHKGSGQARKSAQSKQRSTQANRANQARRSSQQHARGAAQRTRSVARVQRQSYAPRRSYGGGRSFGGGGRSFGGGRGGGRRSDIRVKHDIVLLGRIDNGLGWYRFAYRGGTRQYVGVMAQEVSHIAPGAVMRERDGTMRVDYERLGLKFQSYDQWLAGGGRIPVPARAVGTPR